VEVPEQLRRAIDDAVRRSLWSELHSRGLLLTPAVSASATTQAGRSGAALLRRALVQCYQGNRPGESAVHVEFGDDQVAARIELALAFGAVTANLLAPSKRIAGAGPAGSVDLLCAMFNLGIGLVDGLCDGSAQLGLGLLRVIRGLEVSQAAREGWSPDRLRSALPGSLAADPTVAFTARIIEAFFELLHANYPGPEGEMVRERVGVLLDEALEAESASVGHSVQNASRDQLIECSRLTSVLPFQIIEQLAAGEPAQLSPTAGTLLGEAMWRIDDLVDLTQDAGLGALNAVFLAAMPGHRPAADPEDVVVTLERVLTTGAIPLAAAQAAECLDAGLKAAPGGTPTSADRYIFLSFVQRYAGFAADSELRLGP
jgi:hypothetical protein